MLREELENDHLGTAWRVRLTPREVALGTTATGLPAQAFSGAFDLVENHQPHAWTIVGTTAPHDVAVLAWLKTYLGGLPARRCAMKSEMDQSDEFLAAGHEPTSDENGRMDLEWVDERDVAQRGPHCRSCGYGLVYLDSLVDQVPDCDGAAGLVRRLQARRDRLRTALRQVDADLLLAERAAGTVPARSARDHRWFFSGLRSTPRQAADDARTLATNMADGRVMGFVVAVKRDDELWEIMRGGELPAMTAVLRTT